MGTPDGRGAPSERGSDPDCVLPDVPCDQTREDAPEAVSLFVYGTLMSTSSEHERVRSLLVGAPIPGSVPGSLFSSPFGSWPLLVPGGPGSVHGEVLPVARVPELWLMLGDYEVAWGYELRWLPFRATGGSGIASALACGWPWRDQVGEAVPSGRWVH